MLEAPLPALRSWPMEPPDPNLDVVQSVGHTRVSLLALTPDCGVRLLTTHPWWQLVSLNRTRPLWPPQ